VKAGVARYQKLFAIPQEYKYQGQLKYCQITVDDSNENVALVDADESYQIAVDTSGVCGIRAANQWGVLRALETFS